MRILILEDEPLIAMDLEDIVTDALDADCILASTVEGGLGAIERGIDFALLDIHLGDGQSTSLPVAARLIEKGIPFCFISGSLTQLPSGLRDVPSVGKPFRPRDVVRLLPHA